jgi:hypothetical protein
MYRNSEKKNQIGKETVAHASNLTYMGGWDRKNCGVRPAWAKSLWDPHLNQ